MSKQGNRQNEHSLRARDEELQNRASYKLKPVMKWLMLSSQAFALISHLILTMGLWEYIGQGNTADTVLSTISIFLPIIAIAAIIGVEMD